MLFKCTCLLVSLLYVTSLVQGGDVQKNGGLTIRLNRQKTAFEQHINNAAKLKEYGIATDWLYKKHPKYGPRTNSIPLYRYLDNEFYGTIVFGHPGQTLNVAFDTAWTISWVLSSKCYDYKNIGCLFHHKYDHTRSSEYKPDNRPITIPVGKYNFKGFFSYDNISFTYSNVTNMSFVEMTSVPDTLLFNKIDGVLGLGLQVDSYEPFFYALMRQGKVKQPIFSIYLNRDEQSNHGGNITMGFIEKRYIHSRKDVNNNTIYDIIKYMPVKAGPFWQFDIDAIYFNQQKGAPMVFCNGASCTAITDTSSNNILGPKADIDKIHKAVNARPYYLNRYTVKCKDIDKFPEIGFTIGGQNFTLKGRDYTIKFSYLSVTFCLSAFVPHDYTDFWVLGGAFLSEYYTIYNVQNKKIGIVKAAP